MKKLKKVDENSTLQEKQTELNENLNAKIKALNDSYKSGNGEQIDKANKELFAFMDTVIPKDHSIYVQMKNHTWQRNHLKILAAISSLTQENNRMPTNTEIAVSSRLSEETIYKHLREFKDHELYQHEWDKYGLMIHRVLSTVFNAGVQGDIRACKVYLDYFTNNSNTPVPPTFEQTNYIQINNLKITPDELWQLPPATLQKIESLIKRPVANKK
jgi:hypothetical protein